MNNDDSCAHFCSMGAHLPDLNTIAYAKGCDIDGDLTVTLYCAYCGAVASARLQLNDLRWEQSR